MAKLSSEMLEKPYQSMLNDIKTEVKLRQKEVDADAYVVPLSLKRSLLISANADRTGVESVDPNDVETALWTDRYRPKKFTDLLGDEVGQEIHLSVIGTDALLMKQRVHRSALLWLKEWDQCVFKGSVKNSAAAEAKRERRKKRAREGRPDNSFGGDEDGERAPDAFGRPQEKVSSIIFCDRPTDHSRLSDRFYYFVVRLVLVRRRLPMSSLDKLDIKFSK